MRTTAILLILICFACTTNSCRKYEDGPYVSLRTRKGRVVNKWQKAEGDDYLLLLTKIYSREFMRDGTYLMEYDKDTASTQFAIGTWEFYDKQQYLILHLPEVTVRTAKFSMRDTVQISKLKNDELWLINGNFELQLVTYD